LAYLSLYRKWRPQSFDEVIGQPHVTQTLKNAIGKDRLSHAYLFCGPRGTGKTSVARILAKSINCIEGPTPNPCNKCESCRSVNDGSSLDVLELDAASNRRVEEIRDLLEKIPYSSTQGRKKVYIIDEVHMLTSESFNTLLKTLEEPPEHVIFVLATTEPHKVLPTILSRCQRFDFRRISEPDIQSRLRAVANTEGIDIDEGALALIAHHAQGALRDALGVLEQLASYSKETVTSQDVVALLGLTDSELLLSFTDILSKGDLAEGLLFVDELTQKGFDLRQFIQDALKHLRNLFLVQTVQGIALSGMPDELFGKFSEQAKSVNPKSIMFFINTLNEVYNQSRWATDIRLLLEIAVFKMTRSSDDTSIESILHRIERLESVVASGVTGPSRTSESEKDEKQVKRVAGPAKSKGRSEGSKDASKEKTASPEPGAQPAMLEPRSDVEVDIETIRRAWPQVLKLIKDKKRSRYEFFARAKLNRIDNGRLVLSAKETDKAFIETLENLKLIQSSLKIATGLDVPVVCELAGETAKTVAVAEGPSEAETLSEDDYIKLVQDTFGAKIVEEIPINEIDR